jgi:hypothetical protein
MRPTVGRIVHYVSYGTPGGEYRSEDRAAVITEVYDVQEIGENVWTVGLCVLNPEGLFFNKFVKQDEIHMVGGTWHWPERE